MMINFFTKLLKFFIALTVILMVYKILSYSFPLYFKPFEIALGKMFDGLIISVVWLYEHSVEIFLLWLGRFSKNFKDNVRGLFSMVVLLSTFRLNLARAKALKTNEANGIKSIDM